jgi:hypothetical protein
VKYSRNTALGSPGAYSADHLLLLLLLLLLYVSMRPGADAMRGAAAWVGGAVMYSRHMDLALLQQTINLVRLTACCCCCSLMCPCAQVQMLCEVLQREWAVLYYWSEDLGSHMTLIHRDRDYFALLWQVRLDDVLSLSWFMVLQLYLESAATERRMATLLLLLPPQAMLILCC